MFIKAAAAASTGDEKSSSVDPEDPEASDDDDEWVGHPTMVQHVEVRAVTRGSSVVVDNLREVKGSKELTYDLDFGHVAVGDRVVKSIQLRNLANTSVNVGMSAPDHEGVFTALTAFRPMDPLGDLEVKLAFQPGRCHSFYEIISLKTSLRTIRIAARGEGISPAGTSRPVLGRRRFHRRRRLQRRVPRRHRRRHRYRRSTKRVTRAARAGTVRVHRSHVTGSDSSRWIRECELGGWIGEGRGWERIKR